MVDLPLPGVPGGVRGDCADGKVGRGGKASPDSAATRIAGRSVSVAHLLLARPGPVRRIRRRRRSCQSLDRLAAVRHPIAPRTAILVCDRRGGDRSRRHFALNYSYNFTFRERPALHQLQTFCVIAGLGILLTSAVSAGLRALFDGPFGHAARLGGLTIRMDFAAHLTAIALVALYSFPAHKAISFNVGIRARLRELRVSGSAAK